MHFLSLQILSTQVSILLFLHSIFNLVKHHNTKMISQFQTYKECHRASVGLWGIEPEEMNSWFHCPQTAIEEGCFCNDLDDDLKDCGEAEWITKFCKPILQAEKADQNMLIVSFFVFYFILCA